MAYNYDNRFGTVESVRKMESMVESISEGVLMLDTKGEVVVFNPRAREMFGFGLHEDVDNAKLHAKLAGFGLSDILSFSQKEAKPATKEFMLSDGSRRIIICESYPVRDPEHSLIGAIAILRDITKEKELDMLKTEFISTVSHELRTPLSITKEGISLVLDEVPGKINKKQSKILNTAKENIDRLARIINSLLNISRIESGKEELRKRVVNIPNVVTQVLFAFRPKAKRKGLDMRVIFPKEELDVYADEDKINQIFLNLIGNAVKFTDKGYIEVSIAKIEGSIECIISDTGIGMAPEDVSRLFNKFQQFGRKTRPGEQGTGLGLSITKGIIDMHNGTIRAESEPGKGSRFVFTLPRYPTDALLRENITDRIREAKKDNCGVSILCASVFGLGSVKDDTGADRAKSLLKDIGDLLRRKYKYEANITIRDSGEIIIIHESCGKEDILKSQRELKDVLDNYVAEQKLGDNIKFNLGHASYPGDATNAEELLERAKRG